MHAPRLIVYCFAVVASFWTGSAAAADSSPLMPLPYKAEMGQGALQLNRPLTIELIAPKDAASGKVYNDARVKRAVARWAQTVAEKTHQPICLESCSSPVHVTLAWEHPGAEIQRLDESEAYTLDITAQTANLRAASPLGILRGLQTLQQWVHTQGDNIELPAVHIVDKPRFAWRGLLLDSARHFMPPATVKRNLDAMAAVKMNVLHWHLSDDQGFRVQSQRYPELTDQGAEGEFYTQAEVTDIIHYAADLGIRVVPEFDMPGHVSSWLISHPELGSAPGPYAPTLAWGIFDAALDPTLESTYTFVDNLLQEMTKLFPDAYFHIGGDEVTGVQWRQNPRIAAFMVQHQLADTEALQSYFIHRVTQQAHRYGKIVVGWDEILQPGLPASTVVQSWRGPDGIRQTLDAGYQGILSHGWYLGDSAEAHYLNDPATGLDATPQRSTHLLGGEACQWSELVTPELVDASIWPRTAAVAERLWSDASVRDVADMYRRLAIQSDRLVSLGVTHRSFQERRLVELAGTPQVAPLQMLASVLEAKRVNWWPQFKVKRPLDGFADVLFAESARARQIDMTVDRLLAHPDDTGAAKTLQEEFQALYDNRTALKALIQGSTKLRPIAPVAHDVAEICQIGQQAVAMLTANLALPPKWSVQARTRLQRAQVQELGLQIALAPAVAKLVDRIAGPPPPAAPAP